MTAGRYSIVALLAIALAMVVATPAWATSNRINDVRVSSQGDSTVVEIAGERAPNFTTFKQDSPRRVIVDVAECDLGDVPSKIGGSGTLVASVSTAQYGRSPHGISRVIISVDKAVEYKVTTRGGSLYVHLTAGAGGLLVSAGVPVAPRRETKSASDPGKKSSGDLDLPLIVSPPPEADVEHTPMAELPKAEKPAKAPEKVATAPDVEEPAEELGDEPAEEPAEEPATEPAEESAEPEPVKVAMASAPPPTDKALEPVPPPPAPAPTLVAQDDAEEVEEVEEDDEVPVAPGVGGEVEPPPPPPADEAVDEVPPPPPADDELVEEVPETLDDGGAEEDMPPPPPEDSGSVDVPESPDAVSPSPADDGYGDVVDEVPAAPEHSEVEERVEVSGVLKDMTWVGFQQTMESSRVFIKTTEPVRFHVTEEGNTLVVLELENTRIPMRNNQRFLDTHFFDTAVTMITPREIEGVSRNVRIEIQLRDKVPYTSGQDENMVFLDFRRP